MRAEPAMPYHRPTVLPPVSPPGVRWSNQRYSPTAPAPAPAEAMAQGVWRRSISTRGVLCDPGRLDCTGSPDGETRRQGDKGTRGQGDKEKRTSSPCPLVSLTPCLLLPSPPAPAIAPHHAGAAPGPRRVCRCPSV